MPDTRALANENPPLNFWNLACEGVGLQNQGLPSRSFLLSLSEKVDGLFLFCGGNVCKSAESKSGFDPGFPGLVVRSDLQIALRTLF